MARSLTRMFTLAALAGAIVLAVTFVASAPAAAPRRALTRLAAAAARSTAAAHSTAAARSTRPEVALSRPAAHSMRPDVALSRPTAAPGGRPLAGKIVGIDPGHNGRNYTDPSYIDHLVWNGREQEACDTTGTETDSGYTEAQFNFNVATYLAADLHAEGAKVVLTRKSNDGVGPCVNRRAEIIDHAHANVAIDIHADGGPPAGRGFAVLEPVADGPNDHVIAASKRFGSDVLTRFRAVTGMPVSDYDGTDGISLRDNLAGLNLTTVPKVLIECGNMRNAVDASRLVRTRFQKLAATALAQAITEFLR